MIAAAIRTIACAACIGVCLTSNVRAQEAASSSTSAAAGELQEVVVTANRRQQNLQQVPITVEAITADTAQAFGITDAQSLANAVPGLTFDRATATAVPFIRGVGSPVGQVSAEPSVAMYVDDVYSPAAGASLANFTSLSSLEVEKGPQGTLFGRNATGGVVQVFTKNPTATPALDVEAGYANYNTPSGDFYATGGNDKLAANISLYGSNQGDGWGTNVTTLDPAFKNNKYYGGRAKLLWTPSDGTSLLLAFDYDNTKSSEGFYRPAYGTVGAGFYPSPSGFYDLVDWTNPFWVVKQSGVSLKINTDMHWARLVSITAYRFTEQQQLFDQSGGPFPIVGASINGPDHMFTQEFQLLSPENASLTWIAGAFFMHDSSGYDPLGLSGLAVAPLDYANSYSTQTTKSYAGFADMTWTFAPGTRLTGGLRYTSDHRSIGAWYTLGLPGGGGTVSQNSPNSPQSQTTSKPTGRVSLSHDFTSDIMGYVAFNRGFKSGTFNAVVTPGAPIGAPVQPETLDAYTIGEKAEFFDHRLRINTEGFWYDYQNIQVTEIVPGGTALRNAAKATIKGVDLDVSWAATERLTVTAGFEVLDGHYDSFPNGLYWIYAPNPAAGVSNINPPVAPDLAGNKTVDTPPFTSVLRVNYVQPITAGTLNFSVAYNHGGNYFFDPDNGKGQITPALDKQPTMNIVNASLGWTSPSGRYDVTAWGKNITGNKYFSFGFEEALLTQFGPAPPATYGITFGAHFK